MELSSHDSIAVLAFPPSPQFPRLSVAVLEEIDAILEQIRTTSVFEGVVIEANSDSFATGAEIEDINALEGVPAREFSRRGQNTCGRIEAFPLPVIAAIRGFCLGGGLDLALACRGRVASYDSSLGHPGATLGLITGWGGTQRLSRLLGKSTALHLFLTADRVPATQALSMGLIDELAPSQDLLGAAVRRAQRLRRAF